MTLKTRVNRLAASTAFTAGHAKPMRHIIVEPDETEAESYFRHFGEPLTPEAEDQYFIVAITIIEPGLQGGPPVPGDRSIRCRPKGQGGVLDYPDRERALWPIPASGGVR